MDVVLRFEHVDYAEMFKDCLREGDLPQAAELLLHASLTPDRIEWSGNADARYLPTVQIDPDAVIGTDVLIFTTWFGSIRFKKAATRRLANRFHADADSLVDLVRLSATQ